MLLVLVALGTATILTSAYLAGRDNSAIIGRNVAAGGAARRAAVSGLEVAVAVMETESDWRNAHDEGLLIDALVVGNAAVDVFVVDRETGRPPTGSSRNVEVTAVATIDGVSQAAIGTVEILPTGSDPVDVGLSEFALFVGRSISINGVATVARWSPGGRSASGDPIALGTQGLGSGSVKINDKAAAIDARLFHGPGASSSIVLNADGPVIELVELPDLPPFPAAPAPDLAAVPIAGATLAVSRNSMTVAESGTYGSVQLTRGAVLELDGDVILVAREGFSAEDSTIVVTGNATLVSLSTALLWRSDIVLKDSATLEFYAADLVSVVDGYVGDGDDTTRDAAGEAAYMDPRRIRLMSVPGSTENVWTMTGSSVVKASLYAPEAPVRLDDSSVIYGRVAAADVYLFNGGSIFYDPRLDTGNGFTSPTSPLYADDGSLLNDVKTISTLSDAELASLKLETGLNVVVADDPDASVDAVVTANDPGGTLDAPTPRPVPVRYLLTVFGRPATDWEG